MNFDKLIDHFKLDKQEFYFQFNSHPNYPSALAFSDTLNFLGLKNDAYELDKEYWDELPDEYMALVDNSFSLVKKKGSDFTIYSDKVKTLNKEELYGNSGDFVLLFEKTENIKTKSFFNFKPVIYLVFGLIILYSLLQFTWYESVFNILSLGGVYISLELFNQKFGQESTVVSNICGGAANSSSQSSCSKIFSSDKTDVLGLKLSDFSLIYFLGISFVGLFFPQSQFVLRIAAILSIMVIFYSIYIQSFIEKSLCRVCLVIILVLLAQIAISSFYFSWEINSPVVFTGLILFISVFFTVAFLNHLMNQKEELKKSNAKNLRFKRNYDLFKRELLDQEKITFTDQQTFFVGNKDAKLHISVVSNPYCGFCKDAHKIIEDLLLQYPDAISAQMRFNYSSERADEKYTQLMSDFLSIYRNKSHKEFLKSVDIWFKNKDESEIRTKSGSGNSEDLTDIIKMTSENSSAGITFTPVFIINGYQFPDKYDREDIHYFISELIEDEDF
ncbi:vitamin K epoxide reductase family protein [Chryseobacterium wangxinyae]|uniref:vitamin K epoxide reductase family protein n=1 Tax=Chryseobacterium sp. CY350 TaxID=2997336 RepID=UPI002271B406|nr:vitamin K epoxide reductase family protein [Chryseobacterium sp. CY350]MCY0976209.1 vitamin K epoxide reductase family protein [Chryseobacterium sp. CY350]WBZ94193.1 vitamin K epoxide reductase family protein [Chryseobacterium sp. CY350]